MDDFQVAFVGGGNMARAMASGLLRGGVPAARIAIGEPDAGARQALDLDLGVRAEARNEDAVAGADVVVLAVKPQQLVAALAALRPALQARRPLLLSIAAGIRSGSIREACPGLGIMRAMPNRPALIGAGVSALWAAAGVDAAGRLLGETVMAGCGRIVWVPDEDLLDVVTALSGSGPAYFFWLAEQMAAAATALGLQPEVAATLSAETLYGAGQLAHAEPDLAAQRRAVTSKGGTTEAALGVLATPANNATVAAALQAATRRGSELARQFGATSG
jgi:pyrroline-5-carboxylate reductase